MLRRRLLREIGGYLSGRKDEAGRLYLVLANRALALRRATWGGLFTTIGTLGYYIAYAYIDPRIRYS